MSSSDPYTTGDIETRFNGVSDRLERLSDQGQDFRNAITSTLRYMASDLVNLSNGKSLEFAPHYTDRYDKALYKEEDSSRIEDTIFQGVSKQNKKKQSEVTELEFKSQGGFPEILTQKDIQDSSADV